MPQVSVVIPTYNALGQVEPLLNQLRELAHVPTGLAASDTSGRDIEVIITDDASPDGTARLLEARFPWLTVIPAEDNVGFGANVMRGVRAATGDYLFLLNSDVELCGDSLTPLVNLLASDESIFAAMPLIYNTHLGMVENLARLYCHRGLCWHTELTEQLEWTATVREHLKMNPTHDGWTLPETDAPGQPIPAVLCGAAFLCRRDRFLELDGFDPRYRPFYWEDVALGFAAARRGWRCVTSPQSLVVHRHSESISAKVGERKLRYLIANQLRFVHQYRGDLRPQGLKRERLWWLARSARALGKGDMQMAWGYFAAAIT